MEEEEEKGVFIRWEKWVRPQSVRYVPGTGLRPLIGLKWCYGANLLIALRVYTVVIHFRVPRGAGWVAASRRRSSICGVGGP